MQGCRVTAIDPNRSMESYARENAETHGLQGFEAVEGLAEQLPFDDSSFDRAVCTLVLLPHPLSFSHAYAVARWMQWVPNSGLYLCCCTNIPHGGLHMQQHCGPAARH